MQIFKVSWECKYEGVKECEQSMSVLHPTGVKFLQRAHRECILLKCNLEEKEQISNVMLLFIVIYHLKVINPLDVFDSSFCVAVTVHSGT
jgi:hypothetical protein